MKRSMWLRLILTLCLLGLGALAIINYLQGWEGHPHLRYCFRYIDSDAAPIIEHYRGTLNRARLVYAEYDSDGDSIYDTMIDFESGRFHKTTVTQLKGGVKYVIGQKELRELPSEYVNEFFSRPAYLDDGGYSRLRSPEYLEACRVLKRHGAITRSRAAVQLTNTVSCSLLSTTSTNALPEK